MRRHSCIPRLIGAVKKKGREWEGDGGDKNKKESTITSELTSQETLWERFERLEGEHIVLILNGTGIKLSFEWYITCSYSKEQNYLQSQRSPDFHECLPQNLKST